jgi:beta-glucanase (GH16 family)
MNFYQSLVLSFCLCLVPGPAAGLLAQQPAPPGWKLKWADEFDGSEINRKHWDFDLGDGFFNYESNQWIGGWGNNELQTYTDRPINVKVKDGRLLITAQKESYQGRGYTSARIKSRARDGSPLVNQLYGRIEVRAKLPVGQGVWPAIWMLPQDEKYGTWAASGEIDILEAKGHEPNKIHGTIHHGGRWPVNAYSTKVYDLPPGQSIAEFHTYAIEWEPGEIRWYFDDVLYSTQNFWWSSSLVNGGQGARPAREADLNPWPAPFDKPFYFIFNVAVGGNFGGAPNASTPFPATMEIDFIRVYESTTRNASQVKPRGVGKLPW